MKKKVSPTIKSTKTNWTVKFDGQLEMTNSPNRYSRRQEEVTVKSLVYINELMDELVNSTQYRGANISHTVRQSVLTLEGS